MALTIPHNSQVGIAVANAGGGGHVKTSAFVTPGQAAMPEALHHLSRGMDKLGGAVNEMFLERQRMQNMTDMLEDELAVKDAYRAFRDDYEKNNRGADARGAVDAADAFFSGQMDALRKKWGGNPYLMQAVEKMVAPIRNGGMDHASAYSVQQEKLHQQAISEKAFGEARRAWADPNKSEQERAAALRNYEISLRYMAGQKPDAQSGAWTGGIAEAVDENLTQARQTLNYERAQNLIMAGRVEEAVKLASGGSAGGGTGAASGSGPRGLRNNNPGNIVHTGSEWEGEVKGGDSKFKSFATPEHGIAALGKNLLSYEKKGLTTVSDIINRWAPPKENDTGAYVSTVAKQLGVAPDEKLDLQNPATLKALTTAIIQHENGKQPYSDDQLSAGLEAALGKRNLPPGKTLLADAGITATDAGGPAAAGAPSSGSARAEPGGQIRFPGVSSEQNLRLNHLLRAEERRRESENRKEAALLLHNKDNEIHWAVSSGDFSRLGQMEQNLLRLGQSEAAQDIRKAHEVYEQAKPYLDASSNAPFAEQARSLESAFAGLRRPDNAALVDKIEHSARSALQGRMQAFVKDPAGYAASRMQAAGTDENESPEQHAQRSIKLQEELGRGVPGFEPKVLSAVQAKEVKDKLKDVNVSPDTKFDLLSGLKGYGSLSRRAFSELGISDAAAAAVSLAHDNPYALSVARDMLSASLMKDSDLPQTGETDKAAARTKALESDELKYRNARAAALHSPLDVKTAKDMQEASTRMLLLGSGESLKEFSKSYAYVTEPQVMLRVPRHLGIDAEAAEYGLKLALNTLEGKLPPGLDKVTIGALKQRAVWVGQGDYAVLMNDGMAVPDRDGKPLTMDLREAAKQYGGANLSGVLRLVDKQDTASTDDLNPEFWGAQ